MLGGFWENDKCVFRTHEQLKHEGRSVMNRAVGISLIVLLFVMLVAMLSTGQALAISSVANWSKAYGGTNDDEAYALVQTSDGGYALAGWTRSFGAGAIDFWLVKTDASGNMLWNKTYGGTGYDDLYSMVQTSDGGYALAGYTQSFGTYGGFWLVKTDASGNIQWNKTYGTTINDWAYALVQTVDGGYALAGIGFANLVKTDASGNMQWNKTYGSGYSESVLQSLIQTGDGGYALAGYTGSSGVGMDDFWLVKTDASGNMLWNKTYGGTGDDMARSVIQTGDGGYALVGWTDSFGAGGDDFWLVKTDASGNMLWNKTYGGDTADEAYSVVQTGDGGYALAGSTWSSGHDGDFWLVKTNSNGNLLWSNTYGGTSDESAYSIVRTSDGGYALAGYTDSFGAGGDDFWLVKTDASGGVSQFPFALILGVSVGILVTVILLIVIRAKRKSKESPK